MWEIAAQAGAGVLGTMAQYAANYDLQMQEAKYNEQLVDKMNEYNSPKNQLARYREAGLNPNLMYGNIQNGNQSSPVQYRSPQMDASMAVNSLNAAVSNLLQNKQLELQNKKIQAEVTNMEVKNRLLERQIYGYQQSQNFWDLTHQGGKNSAAYLKEYDFPIKIASQTENLNNLMMDSRSLQNEYQKLSNYEKKFFNEKILPLTYKLKEMEVVNTGYEQAKLAIDAELWRDLRNSEMSSNLFRLGNHLGTVFGRTEVGKAWKDTLTEIMNDPQGWARKKGAKVRERIETWWQKNYDWKWK